MKNTLAAIGILLLTAPSSKAQEIVYDPLNYVNTLVSQIEALTQTAQQYEQLITQYASLDLEKIYSEAIGSITGRSNYQNKLTSALQAIPNRTNGAFGGILGFDGEQRWGKTNPIGDSMGTMLDNMLGRGQRQAEQVNTGLSNGMFDSNKAASSLSQMTATQSLLTEKDKAATLKELSEQALKAEDQQTGQAVQTQAMIEGIAAQNETNTIMATDSLSRQEAMSEQRRNARNRASGEAIGNMQSYLSE